MTDQDHAVKIIFIVDEPDKWDKDREEYILRLTDEEYERYIERNKGKKP